MSGQPLTSLRPTGRTPRVGVPHPEVLIPAPQTSAREGSPVRVGLIGLGYWGPNLLRVLSESPDAEVAWLCDLDPERLARMATRSPGSRTTADVEEILADPDVDAVLLATPVFTHFELASRSLAAGKHTYVEKPLASSTAEADELLAQADARKLTMMCGHTFVYSPPVRAVKEIIDRGDLGTPFFITSSRVNLGLHQRDVSVLWDLGSPRLLDPALLVRRTAGVRLDGRPRLRRQGNPRRRLRDPALSLGPAGQPGDELAGAEQAAPHRARRQREDDRLRRRRSRAVRVFDHGVVYRDPETFGEYHLSYRTGDIVSPRIGTEEPLALQLADFIAAVRSGQVPAGHAALCRDVVRLIEAASSSLQEGGAPVTVSNLSSGALA